MTRPRAAYGFTVFGREFTALELEEVFGIRAPNFRKRLRRLPPELAVLPISGAVYWKLVRYCLLPKRDVVFGPRMVGRKYGEMKVLRRFNRASKRRPWYLCRCPAGHTYPIHSSRFRSDLRCTRCPSYRDLRARELFKVGSRWGPWTVLGVLRNKRGLNMVRCRCQCDTERVKKMTDLRVAAPRPCNRCAKRSLAPHFPVCGTRMTATAVAEVFGVAISVFLRRVKQGVDPELAAVLPTNLVVAQRLRFSGVLNSARRAISVDGKRATRAQVETVQN